MDIVMIFNYKLLANIERHTKQKRHGIVGVVKINTTMIHTCNRTYIKMIKIDVQQFAILTINTAHLQYMQWNMPKSKTLCRNTTKWPLICYKAMHPSIWLSNATLISSFFLPLKASYKKQHSVITSLLSHLKKDTSKLSVHVTCGHHSFLLWWQCNNSCFVDYICFHIMEQMGQNQI